MTDDPDRRPVPARASERQWLLDLADEYAAIVKESRFSLDGHPHRMVIPDRVMGYEVAARDLRMRAAELSPRSAPDYSIPGDHHDNACERRSGHEWPHCHCERRAAAQPSAPAPAKERFVVDHGVLCEYVNHCTCGAGTGGYYGAHEPGCGLEPIAPVEQLVTVESTASVLAGLRTEMRETAEGLSDIVSDYRSVMLDAVDMVEAAQQRLAEGRER